MIIVEGMDNTGKTTLVHNLSKEFNMMVRKTPQEVITDPQKLLDWTNLELEAFHNRPVLYDRFPLISEDVYGPILRGKNVFQGHSEFQGWAIRLNALIIYCRPPIDKILDFHGRTQMEGVVNYAETLISEYDSVMYIYQLQGVPVIAYDYTQPEAYNQVRDKVKLSLGF